MISAAETEVDFEAIHAALERLRALHRRQAEVVTLRVFGGLSMDASRRRSRCLGARRKLIGRWRGPGSGASSRPTPPGAGA